MFAASFSFIVSHVAIIAPVAIASVAAAVIDAVKSR